MNVEICKWYRDAVAPVVFMVDDFCNVWVDTNGSGSIEPGEDWGYARRGEGSSLVFLEEEILKDFPEVKVTFFLPVGIRSGVIANPTISSVSKMINCDSETKAFFRSVGDDPRYEVAYHGTTHGTPGPEAKGFIQEWDCFESLDQALATIRVGKEIFKEVFGAYPRGGKYCGYVSNRFSDESIDKSGFAWWCRYSNVGLYEYEKCTIGGQDYNPLTNFDVKYFGSSDVVDVPTTLIGGLLTSIFHPGDNWKGIVKRILRPLLLKMKLRKLDFLLENKLVICIQEHIAPSRVDGRKQMPNIFDDVESLRLILQYLKKGRVWYCTCSELARYVLVRDTVNIDICSENSFSIRSDCLQSEGMTLTLRINKDKLNKILQPDGKEVMILDHLVDIKAMNGLYVVV